MLDLARTSAAPDGAPNTPPSAGRSHADRPADGRGADRSFALGAEPILVGRAPECAIRSNDPRVSRTHARFFVEQGALWVEDLGSQNGVFLGAQKVSRAQVPIGELVLVGSLMIRLAPANGKLPPAVGVWWVHLAALILGLYLVAREARTA